MVARVSPPAGTTFGWVAAASDGRTFVLSSVSHSGVYRFYRLHLAGDGQPSPLTALPVTVRPGPAGFIVNGIGFSPDGTELGVALIPASATQSVASADTARAAIEVVALGTGRIHTWTAPAKVILSDLSWENNGRILAYLSASPPSQSPARTQLHLVDTTSARSDLAASSTTITLRDTGLLDGAVITPDERGVIAWTGLTARSSADVLREFSARTGQRLRVLYRGPGDGNFVTQGYATISADPSGRHLLVSGTLVRGGLLFGRVDNGRFTALPGPGPSVLTVLAAW